MVKVRLLYAAEAFLLTPLRSATLLSLVFAAFCPYPYPSGVRLHTCLIAAYLVEPFHSNTYGTSRSALL
jgi:hypothetical protein